MCIDKLDNLSICRFTTLKLNFKIYFLKEFNSLMTEMFCGQNGSRNEEYERGENQGGASPYSYAFF